MRPPPKPNSCPTWADEIFGKHSHEPALIAAASSRATAGSRCGTFSQAELTAENRVITRFWGIHLTGVASSEACSGTVRSRRVESTTSSDDAQLPKLVRLHEYPRPALSALEEQRSEKYRQALIAVVSIGVRAGQLGGTDAWLSSHLVSHA